LGFACETLHSVHAVCYDRKVLNSIRNWKFWSVTWRNKRQTT